MLFLAVFRWGVMGYLLSTVVADCMSTLFLVCKERLWRRFRVSPNLTLWRQIYSYCVPLIPAAIFWWVMGVSDRYMVKWFLGSDANGIYAVAYKIPTILTILATVFMDAWQLSAIAESGDQKTHLRFYGRVWDAFASAVLLGAGSIIAFSPLLIRLLADEPYYEAWQYIPLLTLSMAAAALFKLHGKRVCGNQKEQRLFLDVAHRCAHQYRPEPVADPEDRHSGRSSGYVCKLPCGLSRSHGQHKAFAALFPLQQEAGIGHFRAAGADSVYSTSLAGWIAAQALSLTFLFLLGLPAILSTAQVVLHRK